MAASTAKPSNGKKRIILIVVGCICAFVFKLGVFLLFVGMLPAIIAYESDHTRFKFVFSTVAIFNFSGIFPDMMQVYIEGGSFDILKIKILDPTVWLVMYGGAALGWGMVWLSPIIASITLERLYTRRIAYLEKLQKKSEEEWGPEVKGIIASEAE